MQTKQSKATMRSSNRIIKMVAALAFALVTQFTADVVYAGAGWGDSVDVSGLPIKVKTYYANSPAGMQPNADPAAATGSMVDTGTALRKFVDSLPSIPGLAPSSTAGVNNLGQYIPLATPEKWVDGLGNVTGDDYYELAAVEYTEKMHSDLFKATRLRGYVQLSTANTPGRHIALTYPDGSAILDSKGAQVYAQDIPHYLGPLLLATRGTAIRLKFTNYLPFGSMKGAQAFIPVDKTLSGAGDTYGGTDGLLNQALENRISIHWHGGDAPWISDGTPHQWFAPAGETTAYANGLGTGASYQNVPDMKDPGLGSQTFYFPNNLSGRLMFYHDHATAMTRLNVYMGMAAGYLVVDPVEQAMVGTVLPSEQIPLVIQDRTFVPKNIAQQDSMWNVDVNGNPVTVWGSEGDLWFPHVYETNQDPNSFDGTNPPGRWDWGPWFWPIFPSQYSLPSGAYGDVTTTPEAFMDTPIINGTAYPTLTVDPKAYRFRILNASNDRTLNLGLYQAIDKNGMICDLNAAPGSTIFTAIPVPEVTGVACTEVKMVGAVPTAGFPPLWPTDGRDGGVPDPIGAGPDIIQIGNEGGLLPHPALIPSQPVNYEMNRRSITVLNILNHGLLLGGAERADVVIDFSLFNGQTLILYNDAPAPVPAFDPRIDYYTGMPDYSGAGGSFGTAAGYGPNFRTIMQIVVRNTTPAAPFLPKAPGNMATDTAANPITNPGVTTADAAAFKALDTAIATAYGLSQEKPIIPEEEYNTAFGTADTQNYGRIFTGAAAQPTFDYTPTAAQTIKGIAVLQSGTGYRTAPTINIVGGGATTPATAVANVDNVAIPVVSAGTVPATSMIAGNIYTINTVGTTNFALLGSPDNNVGTTFTATAAGTGTGAVLSSTIGFVTGLTYTITSAGGTAANFPGSATPGIVGSTFIATGPGVAPGTASHTLLSYKLLSITLTSPGAGYTSVPQIVFVPTSNGGVGASAAAISTATQHLIIYNKAIQELFEPVYGRMNATLGVELPFTTAAVATTIPLGYLDPATETISDGEVQMWKITHNGVDSHPVHFHLLNVQVINRIGWDGTVKPVSPNEYGWKETVIMHPLEDILVAVRAKRPLVPFGLPQSSRRMDPTQPLGSTLGITQLNAQTNAPTLMQNAVMNFDNEYVWHCHILGHEENDFMRPFVFHPTPLTTPAATALIPGINSLMPAPATVTNVAVNAGGLITWNDPTPRSAATSMANLQNEIYFKVQKAVSPTVIPATSMVVGDAYGIVSTGTTNFVTYGATAGAAAAVNVVANVTVGKTYTVAALGTTTAASWQALGAVATAVLPTVGTTFVAKTAGVTTYGTGTVTTVPVGAVFTATSAGTGTGTVVPAALPATSMVAGKSYTIASVGTSSFPGAVSNTVGTVFRATGPAAAGTTGLVTQGFADINTYTTAAAALANTIVIGQTYTIATTGSSKFNLIGAFSNTVGTVFTATGAGTGTGTVSPTTAVMIGKVPANATSWTDANWLSGYKYQVLGVNCSAVTINVATGYDVCTGISLPSNVALVDTVALIAPTASTGVVVAPGGTSVTLNWTDNSISENAYLVEASTNGTAGPFTLAATIAGTTTTGAMSYAATTVPGSVYTFRVTAVNGTLVAGAVSPVTASSLPLLLSADLSPPAAPLAPTLISTSVDSPASVLVSWIDNATNETGYLLEASTDSGKTFTTLAILPANTVSNSHAAVPGTTVIYRVSAYITTPMGTTYSAKLTALGIAVATPLTPSGLTGLGNAAGTQINLSWNDNSGNENFYLLEYTTTGAAPYTALPNISTTAGHVGAVTYSHLATTPGLTYTYRISAINGATVLPYAGTYSTTVVSLAAPAAPVLMAAVGDLTGTIASLSWTDNSTNEDHFVVEVSADLGLTYNTVTPLYTSPARSAADSIATGGRVGYNTPVVAGSNPYFRVKAVNAFGSSAYSTTGFGVPFPALAPTALATSVVGPTSVYLVWTDNAADETGYQVELSTDGGITWPTLPLKSIIRIPAETTSVGGIVGYVATVAANSNNMFRITATRTNTFGTSYSLPLTSVNVSTAVPLAPVAVTATPAVGGTNVALSWTDNTTNENSYQVDVATVVGGVVGTYTQLTTINRGQFEIEATGGAVSHNAATVAGNVYSYRVWAINGAGASNTPAVVTADLLTPVGAPTAPTALYAAVATPTTVSLVWTDNANNESGYRLEASSDGGALFSTVAEWARTPAESTAVGGFVTYTAPAATGSSYIYRVSAYTTSAIGAKSYSAVATSVNVPVVAPAAPVALTATPDATGTSVALSWTDNSNNESSYLVEVSTNAGSASPAWSTVTTVTRTAAEIAATLGTVSPVPTTTVLGSLYTYRLSAINGAGSSGYATATVDLTPPVAPAAPTQLVTAVIASNMVYLVWSDNSTNETAFNVEASTDGGTTWTALAGYGGWGGYVAANTGLVGYVAAAVPGTSYTYRVTAYRSSVFGTTSYSTALTSSAVTVAIPAAPTNVLVTPYPETGGLQAWLSWTDNANNENDYLVELSTDAGLIWAPTVITRSAFEAVSTGAAKYAVNAVPGKVNTYRVTARNALGSSTTSSANSNMSAPVLVGPTGLAGVVASSTSVYLVWTDNANNESGYIIESSPDNVTFTEIARTYPNRNQVVSTGQFTGIGVTAVANSQAYYRATAFQLDQFGSLWRSTSVTTGVVATSVPNFPINLTATPDALGSSVALSWTDNSTNEIDFFIEVSIDGGAYMAVWWISRDAFEGAAAGGVLNFTALTAAGHNYTYRVSAENGAGPSTPMYTANIVIP